ASSKGFDRHFLPGLKPSSNSSDETTCKPYPIYAMNKFPLCSVMFGCWPSSSDQQRHAILPTNNMNLDQIRNFYEVAVHKSFTLAAEKLYRTQPAISTQVRILEEELGEKLFDRIGKKICLTQAGEILFPYAERLLNLHDEAKLAITEL